MRQSAAIPSDDAYRKPSARADCAKTAPKSSNTQSKHLADHRVCHAYVSALLRKGAFNVSRVHGALSHLLVSKPPFQAWMRPKRHFTIACIQGSPSCLPASTPSRSPKSEAALRDYLNPEPLFAIPCIQGAPSHLSEPKATLCVDPYPNCPLRSPAPKAALCTCPHPKPPHVRSSPKIPSNLKQN